MIPKSVKRFSEKIMREHDRRHPGAIGVRRFCAPRPAERLVLLILQKAPAYGLAGRLHGPKRTPLGSASCSSIISPIVSEVTSPTSLPVISTTATAGADFS